MANGEKSNHFQKYNYNSRGRGEARPRKINSIQMILSGCNKYVVVVVRVASVIAGRHESCSLLPEWATKRMEFWHYYISFRGILGPEANFKKDMTCPTAPLFEGNLLIKSSRDSVK
jgi:hypothetical protein